MSGFYGADTEKLRTHAQLLKDRANTIEDLRGRLEPLVMNESAWTGPDADSFRETWSSRVSGTFASAHEGMSSRSSDLEKQAEQQDTASDEDGGGGILDDLRKLLGGVGKGLGTIWDAVTAGTGLYNNLQGMFSGGKKIWDAVKQGLKKEYSKVEKGFSGLAAKLAGKLHLPTGFGPKNFFSKLDDVVKDGSKLLEKAPWLAKTGRVVSRALPGLDVVFGAKSFYDAYQKGDTFHMVTGGMQTVGGALLTAGTICDATGVGAVVGVPLQVVGGVLVGGAMLADGAKWVHDNWGDIKDKAGKAWDVTTDAASTVKDGVTDAANTVKDKVSDTADSVKDTVSDVGNGLKNALPF